METYVGGGRMERNRGEWRKKGEWGGRKEREGEGVRKK